ncbi:unnamed protein product [Meganyctiphanes norvegica]|uniref:Uncharacterized protein n=1 Tax=Meganyctiphanes norvegica TaxID=48144 RepID=A0AAV2PW01_MEGNR
MPHLEGPYVTSSNFQALFAIVGVLIGVFMLVMPAPYTNAMMKLTGGVLILACIREIFTFKENLVYYPWIRLPYYVHTVINLLVFIIMFVLACVHSDLFVVFCEILALVLQVYFFENTMRTYKEIRSDPYCNVMKENTESKSRRTSKSADIHTQNAHTEESCTTNTLPSSICMDEPIAEEKEVNDISMEDIEMEVIRYFPSRDQEKTEVSMSPKNVCCSEIKEISSVDAEIKVKYTQCDLFPWLH